MNYILSITIIFSILLSCERNNKENKFFVNDRIYNQVLKGVDELRKDHITKNDSIFYIFFRRDSLLLISSEYEDKFKIMANIYKVDFFTYKTNTIIITQPYNLKYNILLTTTITNKNPSPVINDKFDNDYLKGIVYKITEDHLLYLYKGNLNSIFRNKKEYEIPKSPKAIDSLE